MSPDRRMMYMIGRAGLASLFILGGINKILNFEATLATIESSLLHPPLIFLLATIGLELTLGMALAFGTGLAGSAALVLSVFTLATNALFHRFWELSGEIYTLELSLFFKNVAIASALLAIASIESSASRQTSESDRN